MKRDMIVHQLEESDFRELVLRKHKEGEFRGDPHKMEANFKDNKRHIDFIGVEIVDKDDPKFGGFCGIEIFHTNFGMKSMIHCLGTYKQARGNGLSHDLLLEVEKLAKEKYPELISILSTCNPISCKSHEKVGYKIIHPGRLSSTGKLMQIKLEKML